MSDRKLVRRSGKIVREFRCGACSYAAFATVEATGHGEGRSFLGLTDNSKSSIEFVANGDIIHALIACPACGARDGNHLRGFLAVSAAFGFGVLALFAVLLLILPGHWPWLALAATGAEAAIIVSRMRYWRRATRAELGPRLPEPLPPARPLTPPALAIESHSVAPLSPPGGQPPGETPRFFR